jgi:MFS family permease
LNKLNENNGNGDSRSKNEVKSKGKDYSRNIWKFYLYSIFVSMHTVNGALIPFFQSWGKLTFIEIMILQSYFTVVALLFEVPSGAIADFLSRRFTLVLAGVVTAVAALIYSSYPNIFVFALGETFWGFGMALLSGANEAFVYDTLKKLNKEEEFTKRWGRSNSFSILGLMISGPIGSLIAVYVSLQFTMTFSFFPMIIAALIALSFEEPNDELIRESKKYFTLVKEGIKQLRSNKILLTLAFDMIIIETLAFFLVWTYQVYLLELNVDLIYFGIIMAMMTLSEMLSMNIIPKIFEKFKNHKIFLVSSTITVGIAYILLGFTTVVPAGIALILVIMAFGFSRRLIFSSGINKQIESNSRATVLSAISMLGNIAHTISYPFIGIIVEWNVFAVFIFLGSLTITFAILSRVKNEYL